MEQKQPQVRKNKDEQQPASLPPDFAAADEYEHDQPNDPFGKQMKRGPGEHLCQNIVQDAFQVGEPLNWPSCRKVRALSSRPRENRRMQIRALGFLRRRCERRIRRSPPASEAGFTPAPGQRTAQAILVVVASRLVDVSRSPSCRKGSFHFRGEQDQRIVEHPALFEIGKQSGDRPVDFTDGLFDVRPTSATVPAHLAAVSDTVHQQCEPYPVFCQTPCEEALPSEAAGLGFVESVEIVDRSGFGANTN